MKTLVLGELESDRILLSIMRIGEKSIAWFNPFDRDSFKDGSSNRAAIVWTENPTSRFPSRTGVILACYAYLALT